LVTVHGGDLENVVWSGFSAGLIELDSIGRFIYVLSEFLGFVGLSGLTFRLLRLMCPLPLVRSHGGRLENGEVVFLDLLKAGPI